MHWEALRSSAGEVTGERREPDAAVLNELRLDPAGWQRERATALGWWLAAERARREGYSVQAAFVLGQSAKFCEAHGIGDAADLDEWLVDNHCDRGDLESILKARGLAARMEVQAGPDLDNVLLDYLRWSGSYSVLLKRSGRLKTQ
jgi:hypothetical protein